MKLYQKSKSKYQNDNAKIKNKTDRLPDVLADPPFTRRGRLAGWFCDGRLLFLNFDLCFCILIFNL